MHNCAFCKKRHNDNPCPPAKKYGITKEMIKNSEVDLEAGPEALQRNNETVKNSETPKNEKPLENIDPVKDSKPARNSERQRYDPGAADRARRWQQDNPERHREYRREYMREYMRQRRAKLKQ